MARLDFWNHAPDGRLRDSGQATALAIGCLVVVILNGCQGQSESPPKATVSPEHATHDPARVQRDAERNVPPDAPRTGQKAAEPTRSRVADSKPNVGADSGTVGTNTSTPANAHHPVLHPTSREPIAAFFSDQEFRKDIVAPTVLLSHHHLATCRVKLGDRFPDLSLTSFDGAPTTLYDHLGTRLTVVVFWNAGQPMSVAQLSRLHLDVDQPYRDAGVRIVTVHVGDPAASAGSSQADIRSPAADHLLDAQGTAFAEVATELLPRIYVLRPDRSVVWFDLEHSRTTSRQLRNALLYELKNGEHQASIDRKPLM